MAKSMKVLRLSPISLNTAKAAEYIGVSEALLRKLRGDGRGPRFSRIGKKVVYPVPELKKYVRSTMVA